MSLPSQTSLIVPLNGPGAALTSVRYQEKLTRHPGDCGIDLYPCMKDPADLVITRATFGEMWTIPTGVYLLVPPDHLGWITSRSSSSEKLSGCTILDAKIDHGYTGELRIRVLTPLIPNAANRQFLRESIWACNATQTALAQIILVPYSRANLTLMDSLPQHHRGVNGFGSTDHPTVKWGGKPAILNRHPSPHA